MLIVSDFAFFAILTFAAILFPSGCFSRVSELLTRQLHTYTDKVLGIVVIVLLKLQLLQAIGQALTSEMPEGVRVFYEVLSLITMDFKVNPTPPTPPTNR